MKVGGIIVDACFNGGWQYYVFYSVVLYGTQLFMEGEEISYPRNSETFDKFFSEMFNDKATEESYRKIFFV